VADQPELPARTHRLPDGPNGNLGAGFEIEAGALLWSTERGEPRRAGTFALWSAAVPTPRVTSPGDP